MWDWSYGGFMWGLWLIAIHLWKNLEHIIMYCYVSYLLNITLNMYCYVYLIKLGRQAPVLAAQAYSCLSFVKSEVILLHIYGKVNNDDMIVFIIIYKCTAKWSTRL